MYWYSFFIIIAICCTIWFQRDMTFFLSPFVLNLKFSWLHLQVFKKIFLQPYLYPFFPWQRTSHFRKARLQNPNYVNQIPPSWDIHIPKLIFFFWSPYFQLAVVMKTPFMSLNYSVSFTKLDYPATFSRFLLVWHALSPYELSVVYSSYHVWQMLGDFISNFKLYLPSLKIVYFSVYTRSTKDCPSAAPTCLPTYPWNYISLFPLTRYELSPGGTCENSESYNRY